jgi:ATP-dependent helicase/DNAse subunit B
MPLTLVHGPANAAKAGEVLGAYAAAAPRGALLVVPTAADAAHYTAEIAGGGALLGSVLTPDGLFAEIARRAGFSAARLGEHGRAWVIERAIDGARLDRLASAAASPGFREATGALVAELARWLITPARFARAVRGWAGEDAERAAFAEELVALVTGYARALERTGRLDDEAFARRALDALRGDPGRWGAAPVFLYGFDDLDPLQRDAVETLATLCGVEVTVSLTYEAGRVALAARAEAVEALRPLAARVLALPPLDEHYAPAARAALHHLERTLFEPGAGRADAGDAVRLLEAGGARAEAELLAAEVAELIAGGVAPEEIAVVLRAPGTEAPALMRVFESYGIPYAVEHRVPLGHTALGRALLAMVRCAWEEGDTVPVGELLEVIRAPGVVPIESADAVEAALARAGVRTLGQARERLARAGGGTV